MSAVGREHDLRCDLMLDPIHSIEIPKGTAFVRSTLAIVDYFGIPSSSYLSFNARDTPGSEVLVVGSVVSGISNKIQ